MRGARCVRKTYGIVWSAHVFMRRPDNGLQHEHMMIRGSTVLVTGANRGLGRALVRALGRSRLRKGVCRRKECREHRV